jgi:hypothetical protein
MNSNSKRKIQQLVLGEAEIPKEPKERPAHPDDPEYIPPSKGKDPWEKRGSAGGLRKDLHGVTPPASRPEDYSIKVGDFVKLKTDPSINGKVIKVTATKTQDKKHHPPEVTFTTREGKTLVHYYNELDRLETTQTVEPGARAVAGDTARRGKTGTEVQIKVGDKVQGIEDPNIYGKVIHVFQDRFADDGSYLISIDSHKGEIPASQVKVTKPKVEKGWQHKRTGTGSIEVGDKVAHKDEQIDTSGTVVNVKIGDDGEKYVYLDSDNDTPILASDLIVIEPHGKDTAVGYGGVGSPKIGGVLNTFIRTVQFGNSLKAWFKGPYDVPMEGTDYLDEVGKTRVFGKVTRAYGAGSPNYFEFLHRDKETDQLLVLYGHGPKKERKAAASVVLKVKYIIPKDEEDLHPGHGAPLPKELQDIARNLPDEDDTSKTAAIDRLYDQVEDIKRRYRDREEETGTRSQLSEQSSVDKIKILVEGEPLKALPAPSAPLGLPNKEEETPEQKTLSHTPEEELPPYPGDPTPMDSRTVLSDYEPGYDIQRYVGPGIPGITKLINLINSLQQRVFGIKPGNQYGWFVKKDPGDHSSIWKLLRRPQKKWKFNLSKEPWLQHIEPVLRWITEYYPIEPPLLPDGSINTELLINDIKENFEQEHGRTMSKSEETSIIKGVSLTKYMSQSNPVADKAYKTVGKAQHNSKAAKLAAEQVRSSMEGLNPHSGEYKEKEVELNKLEVRAQQQDEIVIGGLEKARDALEQDPNLPDNLADEVHKMTEGGESQGGSGQGVRHKGVSGRLDASEADPIVNPGQRRRDSKTGRYSGKKDHTTQPRSKHGQFGKVLKGGGSAKPGGSSGSSGGPATLALPNKESVDIIQQLVDGV